MLIIIRYTFRAINQTLNNINFIKPIEVHIKKLIKFLHKTLSAKKRKITSKVIYEDPKEIGFEVEFEKPFQESYKSFMWRSSVIYAIMRVTNKRSFLNVLKQA